MTQAPAPVAASKAARQAALAIGLVAAAWYVLAAEPAVGWFDAGELHAAAVELAPSHAPGQPLWTLYGKLLSMVPLGSVALRLGLAGALSGVAAVLAVFWGVYWLSFRTDPELWERTRIVVAGCCGVGFMGLTAVVAQTIRAEVYMPAAALVLVATALVIRAVLVPGAVARDVTRRVALAALIIAVAATAHPAMALCAAIPFGVVCLIYGGPTVRAPRTIAPVMVVVIGAATAYLLIALRAWEAHSWGGGDNWSAFWFHFRAGGYAGNVSFGNVPGNIGSMARFYVHSTGVFALAAVAGAGALLSRRRRGPVLFLWSLVLLVTVFAGAVNTSIRGNPDAQGYVLVAIGALCMLPGVLVGAVRPLAWFLRRWPESDAPTQRLVARAPELLAAFLAVLTIILQQLVPVPVREHPGWASRDYGKALLAAVPPGGILLTYGDHEVFPPIYLQGVEGARPDISVMATGLLSSTWYLHVLKRAYPWLSVPYVDAPAPESAGTDFSDTIHRGILDANPERPVAAADSVFPVQVSGRSVLTYLRPDVRRVVTALLQVLPYEPVAPDSHPIVPPGTWRGDSLVVERALYDAAIRGVTEGDPRAVATLAVLGNWPPPSPPARPDPARVLNSRIDRLQSAFLFTRAVALGGLGDALHAAGRHDEADEVLIEAGEHGLRVVWKARLGDIPGASEALDGVEAEGGDAARFAVLAGEICEEDGASATAAFMYKEAADRSPGDAVPLLKLGMLRGAGGDLSAAMAAFEGALERDSTLADAHVNIGIIHAKRGDLAKARESFDLALEVDPEHSRATRLLARTDDELKTADLEEE